MATKKVLGFNQNFNLIVWFSIIISGLGIAWLGLNGVPAGEKYITIFLVAIGFLFVSFLFIDESNKKTLSVIIRAPFETDYNLASALYIIGWLLPIALTIGLSFLGSSFNVSQLMVPLSAVEVNSNIAQSFSIAQAQSNPFWQFMITVFVAGSIEEFAFGFVLMLVGVLIGMLCWQLFAGSKNAYSNGAKAFYTFFALVFTGVIFGGAHQLNGSYVGYMFLVAIIFRVVMNYAIYSLGLFLSLTLGYHQSNNAMWFYNQYGAAALLSAIFSPGGIVIMLFLGLVVFSVIRNFGDVKRQLGSLLG